MTGPNRVWLEPGKLRIEVLSWPDPYRIRLVGDLDMATCPQVEHLLTRARDNGMATVEVDCAALQFVDSTGLKTLLNPSRWEPPMHVVLHDRSEALDRVLDVCGLLDQFNPDPEGEAE